MEEVKVSTLAERIAALNGQKNFTATAAPGAKDLVKRGKPPPPPPPALPPRRDTTTSVGTGDRKQPPELPVRNDVRPSLPARKTDTGLRSLPPAFGETKLPPLPPKRATPPSLPSRRPTTRNVTAPLVVKDIPPTVPGRPAKVVRNVTAPVLPKRDVSPRRVLAPPVPPALPGRPGKVVRNVTAPVLPKRDVSPRRVLAPPALPGRPTLPPRNVSAPVIVEDIPPPIPLATKPSFSLSSNTSAPLGNICPACYDFSGPDTHAGQTTIPQSSNPIADLAQTLCSPFQHPLEKARALFTWLHHNVVYDWDAFTSGRHPPQDALSTLRSGRAVCAGYAALFTELGRHAGLSVETVTGHGKGVGYTPSATAPAKNPTGHAWNSLVLPGGNVHLLDACWGAGSVNSAQGFVKGFAPWHFTMGTGDFALSHFPSDERKQYLTGGETVTWEGYITRDPPVLMTDFYAHGFKPSSLLPVTKTISTSQAVRIIFSRLCAHDKTNPIAVLTRVNGDLVKFETDGYWWWLDIQRGSMFGRQGENVDLLLITEMDGRPGVVKDSEWTGSFREIKMGVLARWTLE